MWKQCWPFYYSAGFPSLFSREELPEDSTLRKKETSVLLKRTERGGKRKGGNEAREKISEKNTSIEHLRNIVRGVENKLWRKGTGLCEEVRMHGYGLVPVEVLGKITVNHK